MKINYLKKIEWEINDFTVFVIILSTYTRYSLTWPPICAHIKYIVLGSFDTDILTNGEPPGISRLISNVYKNIRRIVCFTHTHKEMWWNFITRLFVEIGSASGIPSFG